MRKSWIQLYAPFIVLALVQALFIAVAPSRGGGDATDLQALGGGGGTDTGGGFESGGDGGDTGVGGFEGGDTGADGASGTNGGGDGTSGGGGGGGAPSGGVAAGVGAAAKGDIGHCKGPLQHNVFLNANPPCVPKFTGENGGGTYQGVTGDKIKVIFFSAAPNEQVDAILAQQGLAVPRDKYEDFVNTFIAFVNKNYELYGRKIEHKFIVGDCPTTPPNYDKCNAAAQEVVKEKPFMVIWNTPLYASVFDIWAKSGIVALGGWQFDDTFFTQRRPFRYDPWMNGTEIGAHLSEYYCKKMAGQNASHSGQVIHPTIGQRNAVKRKLGIVTPEIEANVTAAKRVIDKVKSCGSDAVLFTYESNIETATTQTQATVQGLIDQKVTTVACMCDPIAPAFLTKGLTGNGYYPEYLQTGTQFTDADLVGRLYDQRQMEHAFGIGLIPQQTSLAESDSTRMWRAMGKQGTPCAKDPCGTTFPYVNLMGTAIQMAGPKLNPLTLEQGLLNMPAAGGWEATGGKATIGLWKFGKGDYTWLSDMREIYWDANAPSPVDGERGAFITLNNGQRYDLGEWKPGFTQGIPVRA